METKTTKRNANKWAMGAAALTVLMLSPIPPAAADFEGDLRGDPVPAPATLSIPEELDPCSVQAEDAGSDGCGLSGEVDLAKLCMGKNGGKPCWVVKGPAACETGNGEDYSNDFLPPEIDNNIESVYTYSNCWVHLYAAAGTRSGDNMYRCEVPSCDDLGDFNNDASSFTLL